MNVKDPETLLDQEFGLLAELVYAYAQERPRHPALIDDQRDIDYGDLDQLLNRVAMSLQREQMRVGDTVAICAASSVEYASVFLGALRAGIAVAPLPRSSTPESLVTMLADSGARISFADATVAAMLATVALPPGLQLIRLDAAPGVRSLDAWLAPSGSSGGFNIYPSDLEAVLLQHVAVHDAAVIGVPSKDWGETPVAFAVLRPDAAASAEQIKQWVSKRLGKTQRLAAVELVTELPRNAIGKVLKRELRDRYPRA